MALSTQITALAAAVRDKINAMMPRLVPSGGTTGQALVKASNADYATGWQTVSGGGAAGIDGGSAASVFTPGSGYDGGTASG